MRKLVIGAVAAASLVGGSAAIAAINPLGIASAQNPPTTQAPTTDPGAAGPQGTKGPHGPGPLGQTLKDLVANGTITQAQADAVTDGVKAKMKDHMGPGGPGGRGPGRGDMKGMLDVAAAAIGIDAQTLLSERQGGKTLADVARAHNVDPQKVIDALVAKATADIDQAVADGKLSADKAATAKAKLAERFTELVNNGKGGFGPGGPGGHGGPGGPGGPGGHRHGPGQDDPTAPADPGDDPAAPPSTDAPAPTTEAPTTEAPTTTAPATTGTTGA